MLLPPILRAHFASVDLRTHTPFGTWTRAFATALFLLVIIGGSSAQQSRFDVLKGDDVVGRILASRSVNGERTTYLMTSYSEFDIIWKQVVRSILTVNYMGDLLDRCHTSISVNGALRDSSHLDPAAEPSCFIHPGQRFPLDQEVKWTTARMYFEEPVGQRTIFVESVLKHCPLESIGPGKYRLTLPGDKVNNYAYKDGVLQEIHVDRSFFDLIFRRTV